VIPLDRAGYPDPLARIVLAKPTGDLWANDLGNVKNSARGIHAQPKRALLIG
jgi:hypothetical protein